MCFHTHFQMLESFSGKPFFPNFFYLFSFDSEICLPSTESKIESHRNSFSTLAFLAKRLHF